MRPVWKKSRRSRPTVSRSLACEALENRCLLTIAAFTVNLYEDTGAGPGELISDDVVQAGENFYVEILAREYDPLAAGLRGVALDIAWDPTVFQEIDAAFEPADPTSSLVTQDFPLFRTGELDNNAGTIENLAGAAFLSSGDGRAIGNAKAERFSLLHFQALQPAENAQFSMRQGLSSIVTVPVFGLGDADLYFEQPTITVTPGSVPVDGETPSTESPSTESPSTESPTTESPTTESPVNESPVSETPVNESPVSETPVSESSGNESASTESLLVEFQLAEPSSTSPTEVLTVFVGPLTAEDYFKVESIDAAVHGEESAAPMLDHHDCWSNEPVQQLSTVVLLDSHRGAAPWPSAGSLLPELLGDSDLVIDETEVNLVSGTSESQPAAEAIDAVFADDESVSLLDEVEAQLQQIVEDRYFPL